MELNSHANNVANSMTASTDVTNMTKVHINRKVTPVLFAAMDSITSLNWIATCLYTTLHRRHIVTTVEKALQWNA